MLRAVQEETRTHTCTEVAATQVAEDWNRTQWLNAVVHPSISMVDRFDKLQWSENFPRRLKKAKSGCTKVYTTPAAHKQR